MMTITSTTKVLLQSLLLSLLVACTAPSGGVAPLGAEATRALLAAQAAAWDQAIVRKDRAAIAANMSEDFRQIDGDGDISDREQFLRDITDAALTIVPYTVEDLEIRLYGDMALLSGRTRMSGSYQGKPFETQYRYIDIYRRHDGRWQICSVQISRLPR